MRRLGGLPALIDPPWASATWRAKLSTDGAAHDSNDHVIYNPTTGGLVALGPLYSRRQTGVYSSL